MVTARREEEPRVDQTIGVLHDARGIGDVVVDVALFGTNLTDEEYLEHGFFAAAFGFNIGLAGRPREWGLSAQVRF